MAAAWCAGPACRSPSTPSSTARTWTTSPPASSSRWRWALVGWIEHTKSFYYVRAYSRRYGTLCELTFEGGQVRLKRRALPDLLMHYLLNVMEGSEFAAKRQIDMELQTILSEPRSRTGRT